VMVTGIGIFSGRPKLKSADHLTWLFNDKAYRIMIRVNASLRRFMLKTN